jgi:TIR domain
MTTLRVLVAIAAPGEEHSFNAEDIWANLRTVLGPDDRLRLGRASATEREITAKLVQGWDVLHLVTSGQGTQHYGTLTLEGHEGAVRNVTPAFLARLLAQSPSLRLVVVQTLQEGFSRGVAAALVRAGLRGAAGAFGSGMGTRAFYSSLAEGSSLDEAARASAGWICSIAGQLAGEVAPEPAPPTLEPPANTTSNRLAEEIARKRATGTFDVFLCHNNADKSEVRAIAQLLLARAILPWFDEWELRPGTPWQRLLEDHIGRIGSAAVFVGADGMGPWQRHEAEAFLREFNRRECVIIPVLLQGAPHEPKLPLFLQSMTWVDFRVAAPDPLESLRWGITGNRPWHL